MCIPKRPRGCRAGSSSPAPDRSFKRQESFGSPADACGAECAPLSCRHDGADTGRRVSSQRSIRHYRIQSSHACSCLSRRIGRVSQPGSSRVGGLHGIVDERSRRQRVRAAGQASARGGEQCGGREAGAANRSFAITVAVEGAGRGACRRETCAERTRGPREDRQGSTCGRHRAEGACRREAEGRAGTQEHSRPALTRRAHRR